MAKSIAILGASSNREKFGNKAVRAYISMGWVVFPINPKEESIEGVKCYASIKALPQKPQRVSIYLPPQITISLIPELKAAGAREIILNPGAESDALIEALEKSGIKPLLLCSIRDIGIDPGNL